MSSNKPEHLAIHVDYVPSQDADEGVEVRRVWVEDGVSEIHWNDDACAYLRVCKAAQKIVEEARR